MYRVILVGKSENRTRSVRALRRALPLGLVEASNVIDHAELPLVLLDGVDEKTAKHTAYLLERDGLQAKLEKSTTEQPMIFYRRELRNTQLSDVRSPIVRWILSTLRKLDNRAA